MDAGHRASHGRLSSARNRGSRPCSDGAGHCRMGWLQRERTAMDHPSPICTRRTRYTSSPTTQCLGRRKSNHQSWKGIGKTTLPPAHCPDARYGTWEFSKDAGCRHCGIIGRKRSISHRKRWCGTSSKARCLERSTRGTTQREGMGTHHSRRRTIPTTGTACPNARKCLAARGITASCCCLSRTHRTFHPRWHRLFPTGEW